MKSPRKYGKNKWLLCLFTSVCTLMLQLYDISWANNYIYSVISPPGWTDASAYGINDTGEVVGNGIDSNGLIKGFIYAEGIYYELLPPDRTDAVAYSVNNSGAVVGDCHYGTLGRAFLYKEGTYTELLPPGCIESRARDINDDGVVVGYGHDGSTWKAFIYSKGGYTQLLPPGWTSSYAWTINNNGDVVGFGYAGTESEKGFLYTNGTYTELLPEGLVSAHAHGINDNGVVVGMGWSNQFPNGVGFIYEEATYTLLMPPPGWSYGAGAYGINNYGVIVGRGVYKGFTYSEGQYTDLLPPNWSWCYTQVINNSGDVVGWGKDATGTGKGFIATPVHKPVTIDIKPGSYPNSINLNSKGVVPVVVLTTDDFDASDVEAASVKFADAFPVKWTMEDVDGDGDMDMLFHFDTQILAELAELNEDSTEATLTGSTYGGQPIEGTDTVNIVPKK